MNTVDVFFDLESLGTGSPNFNLLTEGGNVDTLLSELPDVLVREDCQVGRIWGTACVLRRKGRLPGQFQNSIRQIFYRHGGTMVWSNEIGDTSLIKEVRKLLKEETLAPRVLLIACDQDFVDLVKELVSSRRFVFVSGHQVSNRLKKVASKTIPLDDFFPTLKLKFESVSDEESALRNPIPLP